MAIGRTNYTADAVAAARSVLLELTHLLGQYRDDIVVVGGWVPELLLPQSQAHHIGSTDVDLALNHRTLQEAGYRTIKELDHSGLQHRLQFHPIFPKAVLKSSYTPREADGW